MTLTRHPLLSFALGLLMLLVGALAVQALVGIHDACADPSMALAVADASGDLTDAPSDVFSAGRRSGFLFVAVGIGIAALSQAVRVRLKPRDDKPAPPSGSWRARLLVILGAVSMVALAVVDMFAESRGLTPVTTAAIGALALVRYSKDDPARGSKRAPDEDVPS